jgi:hypothetical protein
LACDCKPARGWRKQGPLTITLSLGSCISDRKARASQSRRKGGGSDPVASRFAVAAPRRSELDEGSDAWLHQRDDNLRIARSDASVSIGSRAGQTFSTAGRARDEPAAMGSASTQERQ